MKKLLKFWIISLLITACSGISLLTSKPEYSEQVLSVVNQAQIQYRGMNPTGAVKLLESLDDEKINVDEKALKYNWLGIVKFSTDQYEPAANYFLKALSIPTSDQVLASQIILNLSSPYFKLNRYEDAYIYVKNIAYSILSSTELEKFNKLYFLLSHQLDKKYDLARALIIPKLQLKSLNDVANSPKISLLQEVFNGLNQSQKDLLFDEFDRPEQLVIAYLAIMQAKNLYYNSDKAAALDLINLIGRKFVAEDVQSEISEFKLRMENVAKLNADHIGVVLSLSGNRANFSQAILQGIDTLLTQDANQRFKLFIKDSHESDAIARQAIRELIEQHSVAVIIGGLFSDTAASEYLEARKYGVMFISLSPIYLSKDLKSHLLVEVPGSIESQIEALSTNDFLTTMGERVALFYPDSARGKAYLNELWRKTLKSKLSITSVASYPAETTDYRNYVSQLLGIFYKRERIDEYELWSDIWSKERSAVRRIQTLPPVIEFDWVLVPAHPKEAIQLIPVFNYFDAKKIKFVGGPSWRSKSMIKNYRSLGRLHFIGDDQMDTDHPFVGQFQKRFSNKIPGLLEVNGAEALKLAINMLSQNISSREEFELRLINDKKINGVFGRWSLIDNIWIKEMVPLRFYRNNIIKLEMKAEAEDGLSGQG